MTPTDGGYTPIYDRLVGEQGDAPAQARQAAEAVQRSAGQVPGINGGSHEQPDTPRAQQPGDWFRQPAHEAASAWSH